jgi:DNA-binding XRE family transcriptional regulator
MKLSELSTLGQVIGHQAEDPEFRQEWDPSAFAREAAIRLVRCRVERGLTQAQLAWSVGLQQSVIARLERGEQPPSLARITAGTGIGAAASRDHELLLAGIRVAHKDGTRSL